MSSTSVKSAPSTRLKLVLINLDGGTQGRVALDESVIADYAALMSEGVLFPPVRIWFDGKHYWLADGFHRVEAARRAGLQEIAIEFRNGTLQDAQWDSFRANATNGLRRSKADLQVVVSRALVHQRATKLSTNCLARHIGIPESTLRRWKTIASSQVGEDADRVRIVARNGTTYRIDTKNIGSAGSTRRPLRAGHRLAKDLEEMKSASSQPEVRRVLAVLDKWFCGLTGSRETLDSLDRVLRSALLRVTTDISDEQR